MLPSGIAVCGTTGEPVLLPSESPLPAKLLPLGLCSTRAHLAHEPPPTQATLSGSSLCSSMNPKERLAGWEVSGVPLSPSPLVLLPCSSVQCLGLQAHPWRAVPSNSSSSAPRSGLVLPPPSFHDVVQVGGDFFLELLPILGSLCIYILQCYSTVWENGLS